MYRVNTVNLIVIINQKKVTLLAVAQTRWVGDLWPTNILAGNIVTVLRIRIAFRWQFRLNVDVELFGTLH